MPASCPQCGTPLPVGALAGLCPACLLRAGAAADTISDAKQPAFQPPAVAELAAKFPQLELLELIGKGGMGAVYKARQTQLDRVVALKILPPGIGDDPAFAERFAREAKALAKLNHPGIVTIYDFGRTDGLFYFIMEFVDGVNLRQLLHAGRVSPREALAIVPQICDALQFAHDQGIVHRDIKPENILLDRRGRVKVADFGLAKIVGPVGQTFQSAGSGDFPVASSSGANTGSEAERRPAGPVNQELGKPAPQPVLTESGKVMGTPQYMAPEQREHPDTVDHRADIYALGVVFYQMLTGELPGKTIAPPSSKVHIDVRLDEVVLRALEKKPELRFQQASVLKTEVETIAGTPPGGSRPEEAQTEKGKSGEGLRTAAATDQEGRSFGRIAFGLFLAGTLGSLLLLSLLQRPEQPVAAFGGMALVLALALGLMSWHERLGKFVVVATSVLFVISALGATAFWARSQARVAQEQQERQLYSTNKTQEGWQRWQAGKLAEAEAIFKQAVEVTPGDANAWNGLGWSQFNAGNRKAAEISFQKAIAIEPNQPGALNGLGQISLSQRRYDNAEKCFLQAAPQAPAAWFGLARLYLLQGKFEQAEKWAQNIVDSGQGDETVKKMLEAAKAKKLSEGLRMILEALDDAPLKSAVGDAEEKLHGQAALPSAENGLNQLLAQQPPVVVETYPVSGAQDVPPGETEIRVRFSKPMRDGSWSWATAWEDSTPASVGAPRYLANQSTCVLKVRLEPGKTYAWWLNSDQFKNFQDRAGQPAVPYLLTFQTQSN